MDWLKIFFSGLWPAIKTGLIGLVGYKLKEGENTKNVSEAREQQIEEVIRRDDPDTVTDRLLDDQRRF